MTVFDSAFLIVMCLLFIAIAFAIVSAQIDAIAYARSKRLSKQHSKQREYEPRHYEITYSYNLRGDRYRVGDAVIDCLRKLDATIEINEKLLYAFMRELDMTRDFNLTKVCDVYRDGEYGSGKVEYRIHVNTLTKLMKMYLSTK